MISVSKDWVAAQNGTLLPEMFIEITSNVSEPGLQEDATVTGSNEAYFSNTQNILQEKSNQYTTYATVEQGIWGLDGSLSYMSDENPDTGYVSENLSNYDCSFSEYPTLTFDFSMLHTELVPGITIVWGESYNEWASEFRVTVYNSSGVVAQTTVVGNTSHTSDVWIDLVGYNKITIEVMKWSLPYHRARCNFVYLGIRKVYTKEDLVGYDHEQSVDLLSAALPKTVITFKLRNDNNTWNPDNPANFEKYLLEEQPVKIRYGMDVNGAIEWIKGGTYWLSEWETPSNGLEAVFKAKDSISFMVNEYTGPRTGTLYDIATATLVQENIDAFGGYFVDESLKDIDVDFSFDDGEYKTSEILQMVAHAGRCVLYQDRDGVVRIEPWKEIYANYVIGQDISYSHPEYTIGKPLKAISVSYGDRQKTRLEVSTKGETQTINNPIISSESDALAVANVAKEILENRKTITGEYRADMRLDVLDNVIVSSKYASNVVCITDVKCSTTGGAFRGTYTGRVVSISLEPVKVYSNEVYVNELW